jgi:hypothetical protein
MEASLRAPVRDIRRYAIIFVAALAAMITTGILVSRGPTPAYAQTHTISINKGNVPTTAKDFGPPDCDPNFGGGPFPDQDVWVFVLPGNDTTFVSLTLHFDTNGDGIADTTRTIPMDGGAIVDDHGTSKAWIATPAGWTLVNAEAEVEGPQDSFNLTHTCAASGSPSPSMSPSPSHSPSRSPSASPSQIHASVSLSASPSRSASRSPSASPSHTGASASVSGSPSTTAPAVSPSRTPPLLPTTGLGLTGLIMTGLGLLAAGITVMLARRHFIG